MNNVKGTEKLGRYIFSKHHYKPSNSTVRHAAFMPPSNRRLSVFVISELNAREIWFIGKNLRPDKELIGRADIIADHVYKSELDLELDNNPERHAEIVSWPEEDSAIKLKAMELAKKATLQLK